MITLIKVESQNNIPSLGENDTLQEQDLSAFGFSFI